MPKRGRKYIEAASKFDRDTLYSVADAVKLLKDTVTTKFDPTVEVHHAPGC